MARHRNCEGSHTPRLPAAGPGRLAGGGLVELPAACGRRPAIAGYARAGRRAASWSGWTAGRAHFETFDPKPDAPPRSAASSSRSPPRSPASTSREHMTAAGRDQRQARDRPLDPPRPGQPRRRQPLHDDRRPAANSRRLRGVRQLSSEPGLGRRPTSGGAAAGCRRISRCPRMSRSGGPEFPGREVRPVRRRRRSQSRRVPRPRRRPARRLDDDRFDGRRDLRARSTASSGSPTRRRAIRSMALDEYYEQGYDLSPRKEAQQAFDIQSEPDSVRDAYGRNPFGQRLCWPGGWSRPACRSSRSTTAAGTTTPSIFEDWRKSCRRSNSPSPP